MNERCHLPRPLARGLELAFDAIGVNEKMIQRRRNVWLQIESNETAVRSKGDPIHIKSAHFFGSQSEGTTTPDLKSDMDTLLCIRNYLVIDDIKELNKEKLCFRLIQDERTSPGYCLLKCCDSDILNLFCQNDYGTVRYLPNSASFMFVGNWHNSVSGRQGPASHYVTAYDEHVDVVNALPCKSWPKVVQQTFRDVQQLRNWPGDEMVEQMIQSECFVVPTPSKEYPDSKFEWRISFSSAERLLMFSLKTSQIRCYILLKYIKKTTLDVITKSDSVISSYICKTTLFHTISNTPKHIWEENDLLQCLNLCLVALYNFISRNKCPHFIVPSNNLLLKRLDSETHNALLETLRTLIRENGQYLYDIQLDKFGYLLRYPPAKDDKIASNNQSQIEVNLGTELMSHILCYYLQDLCIEEQSGIRVNESQWKRWIADCGKYLRDCTNDRDKNAARIQISLQSSILGSIMSSNCIQYGKPLSTEAFQWLLLGIQSSDVMSTHLKLASALYCSHDFECTTIVLNDVLMRYNPQHVLSRCFCKRFNPFVLEDGKEALHDILFFQNKTIDVLLKKHLALCVYFTPDERYCIPKELQYEMYKITFSKTWRHAKVGVFTKWMISATVSSLAYTYFLQYKLNHHIGALEESEEALNNMADTLPHANHPHRETTWNLNGQTMEQIGNLELAFLCYQKSLRIEKEINAARILICCNINKLLKGNS